MCLSRIAAGMLLTLPASAQVFLAPRFSIPPPPAGLQSEGALGSSVAVDGGLTVLGAPKDDFGARDSGVVKGFNSTTGALLYVLPNPTPAEDDSFGFSVGVSGRLVVVGAYADDTGASNVGSVYVYDLSRPTPTVPVATLNNPGPAVDDYFGYSVAISGTRVVVGGSRDRPGRTDPGSVYVYDLSSGTPTVPAAILNNPVPAPGDFFGFSVAISGTRVVTGAINNDTGAPGAGIAYLYDISSNTPTVPVATLRNPAPAAGDNLGWAVAIDGTTAAISAPFDDGVMLNRGYAWVFDLAAPPVDGDGDGLLDSWELTHWPTTAGHGPMDDFDHDGYNDLLELALGLNPTLPDPGGLPPVVNEGGYLTVTIAKRPGASYEAQSASTLLSGQPDSFSAASTTVLINDATTFKARDNLPVATPARRFIRVKVTAAP